MTKCAVEYCKQPADHKCQRCGERICYDHLVAHRQRKRDHGEPVSDEVFLDWLHHAVEASKAR